MTSILPVDPEQIAVELKRELSKYSLPEDVFSRVEIYPNSLELLTPPVGLDLIVRVEQVQFSRIVSFGEFLYAFDRSSGFLESVVSEVVEKFKEHRCSANRRFEERKLRAIALVSSIFKLQFLEAKRQCDRWIERYHVCASVDPRAWDVLYRLISSGRIQLIEGMLYQCQLPPISWAGINPALNEQELIENLQRVIEPWSGNLHPRNLAGEQLLPERELEQEERDFLDMPSLCRSPEQARPATCQDCTSYYGGTDGGNRLICGIHPYGWDAGEHCPDWRKNEQG